MADAHPNSSSSTADNPTPYSDVPITRWVAGTGTPTTDQVAEELPVALIYEDVPHVVMLATPQDLVDFAVGFTLSEALVERAEEIRDVKVTWGPAAADVRVSVAWERFSELLHRRRNLTGRTGCGLCGAEKPEDAIRVPAAVGPGPEVDTASLHEAIAQLGPLQRLNSLTGSVHAAAWVVPGKGIQLVREDVGRHNALDKAIGAVVRAGSDTGAGYMLVTSRASYEMVQKTATVGISMLVALSAPTAFAVRLAGTTGLTLVAFARKDRHVVYTHPARLRDTGCAAKKDEAELKQRP